MKYFYKHRLLHLQIEPRRFIRELEQGKESCHMVKALNVVFKPGMNVQINGVVL